LLSIFGMRRATSSSVSSSSSRRWRIALPSFRVSGSARVRLGNGGGLIAVHEPASLDFFCAREHSTCSPSRSKASAGSGGAPSWDSLLGLNSATRRREAATSEQLGSLRRCRQLSSKGHP
jgi:hypothetical protein